MNHYQQQLNRLLDGFERLHGRAWSISDLSPNERRAYDRITRLWEDEAARRELRSERAAVFDPPPLPIWDTCLQR